MTNGSNWRELGRVMIVSLVNQLLSWKECMMCNFFLGDLIVV